MKTCLLQVQSHSSVDVIFAAAQHGVVTGCVAAPVAVTSPDVHDACTTHWMDCSHPEQQLQSQTTCIYLLTNAAAFQGFLKMWTMTNDY